jgi:hypothetical protein
MKQIAGMDGGSGKIIPNSLQESFIPKAGYGMLGKRNSAAQE